MKLKLLTVAFLVLAMGGGFWLWQRSNVVQKKPEVLGVTKDKYEVFVDEIYDKIQQNYWEKISDDELSNLFLLAIGKIDNKQLTLASKDKNGVDSLLETALASRTSDDQKKVFVAATADMVVANLKPFERSRLYSQKDEQSLSNNVNNVNPTANHFQALGVGKSATDQQVAQAFAEKEKELAPAAKTSTTAATKLAEVKQAYSVLKNSDSRQVYAISGVEPTIEYKTIGDDIYYIHMTKFSPTSLDEFVRVAAKVDGKDSKLDTLIFDLRDNIGGAIDQLPYFLGPFIGPDNYAYQFYQQGNKQDFKTQSGWLNSLTRYKKVVILINERSQSTAELMAASLKKYNVGVLVGTTTKGWGTVERVFPLDHQIDDHEKFSLFLVHHITLREDGLPIEGRGVDPTISVKDPNWQKILLAHFNQPDIVKAVAEIFKGN